jgi:hypothetical protein
MTPGVDGRAEQTYVVPRCGGDVDALTSAVSLPHNVVGGHFRSTPWFGLNPKKVFADVELRPGMIST